MGDNRGLRQPLRGSTFISTKNMKATISLTIPDVVFISQVIPLCYGKHLFEAGSSTTIAGFLFFDYEIHNVS